MNILLEGNISKKKNFKVEQKYLSEESLKDFLKMAEQKTGLELGTNNHVADNSHNHEVFKANGTYYIIVKDGSRIERPEPPHPEPPTPAPDPDSNLWKIIGLAVISFVILLGFWHFSGKTSNTTSRDVSQQSDKSEVVRNVFHHAIFSSNGTSIGYWTGNLINELPDGEGVLEYLAGDTDGRKEYKGEFKQGKRDSKSATLLYQNGNTYVGSFVNDNFEKGKLTLMSDGMYYEGTFKDNQPYNGTWYFMDGKQYSEVINGMEE